MWRRFITGMMAAGMVMGAGSGVAAYATQRTDTPRYIKMEYTLAMCKGKPVGFWEYDYTIFSRASDLNFTYTLKVQNMQYRVPRGVYEFYKSHPKEIKASMFARGQIQLYDIIQLHVPAVTNAKWHQWYRVDLTGSQSPVPVAAPTKKSGKKSSAVESQQCPAGTVPCSG